MSQRVAKVESLIQQVAATVLRDILEADAAAVTVTRVDAAPDLHNATIWIGVLSTRKVPAEKTWKRIQGLQGAVQAAVAKQTVMKYSPHLHLKLDTGGAYADQIDRLLKGL